MCTVLAIFGVGIGFSMQILTLIVQNAFPNAIVGTATAATNYFRQVGASVGSAIVGSMFIARLHDLLAQRLPISAGAVAAVPETRSPREGVEPSRRDPHPGDRVPITRRCYRSSCTWSCSPSSRSSCCSSSRRSRLRPWWRTRSLPNHSPRGQLVEMVDEGLMCRRPR